MPNINLGKYQAILAPVVDDLHDGTSVASYLIAVYLGSEIIGSGVAPHWEAAVEKSKEIIEEYERI